MTKTSIFRHKGCRLLLIEPVHRGSSFLCILHLSIPVSGSLNSFSAFSHYFSLALFAVLPADTCCLLLTPNIVTRMTSTRQIAVVKEITRKSGPNALVLLASLEIAVLLVSLLFLVSPVPQKYLTN